ncbi:protein lethal(2)denticleless isoform X2 [Ceratina calcarata]|uniref:Protein lethal(2)denticleless isoform X2 n=1 Tax=Ceratina calcarata TaxID=156304 RepID=A0AAJ7RZV2_9HYME|nr:protein lethal(2)denticleless isoform X2 [Ceratina calcarata]
MKDSLYSLPSIRDYDVALYRLKCYENDVYRGIVPNANANTDLYSEPPAFACRFCTTQGYEQVIALANEDGRIALQDTSDTSRRRQQLLNGAQAHCNAIFDVAWMPGELKLVTASGDHTAKLWDVGGSDIKQVDCFHAHTRSVKTAVFRYQDQAVFATGARDGCIMIWDVRASHLERRKPDNCIINAHNVGTLSNVRQRRTIGHVSKAQSITGLAFQDDFTLISCAAGDGLIKVWDLRKNYTVHKRDPVAKHTMNHVENSRRTGFSSLLICPARITLYASCMDNIIYTYNISSYNSKPMGEFYGHQNRTYYVKTCLSPDGRYIASGSSDELAYIWRTNKPGAPVVQLSGHTEEVTCIAWCGVGETKLITCSDDSCHRIWRVGYEHTRDNEEIEIRGRAKPVSLNDPLENLKLEMTPTVTRRRIAQESTPGSDDNTPGSIDRNDEDDKDRTNVVDAGDSSMKRSYSRMMGSWSDGKFKSVLSPIQENVPESATKRIHLENRGARRLFSSCNDNSSSLYRGYESDEPSTSSTGAVERKNDDIHFSPTSNLPNFVIDGTAPHLLQLSPQKYKENVDWLTRIRREKYEKKRGTAAKTVSEKLASPVSHVTPARRNGRSRSTEPQKVSKMPRSPATATSPAPSLLNFFKLTGKNCNDGC